jgi:pyrimidine-nucleoside phosphorylase
VTALEIIRQKRDGLAHTSGEIAFMVTGAATGAVPDYQLAAWLMAIRLRGMTESETHALTVAMARSGRMLDLSSIPGKKVDKHSTGGVGDKATLVVTPMVAAAGIPVAKLSGRALGHSGGTLDKLEAIPGFRVDLSVEAFIEQVRRIGIAIAGQTADIAPADKTLYALRDATATVDSVPLIASSVMSKKLAAGADAIVLDVKAGRGAFLETQPEAEALARMLVAIGVEAGRQTVAYVTDMDQPLGHAVGNALEIAETIETLRGAGPADLRELSLRLGAEMLGLAGAGDDLTAHRERLAQSLRDGRALRKFGELIAAQGGDPRVCDDPTRLPRAPEQHPVLAPKAGVVSRIDALEIGLVTKALGAGRDRKEDPINPAVGIVVHTKVGDPVQAGQPLATVHAAARDQAEAVRERVVAAFAIDAQAAPRPLILARITASENLATRVAGRPAPSA